MSERLPPYRFRWQDHALRIMIGNFVAMVAVAVFAGLKMLPFWLILIPIVIHVAIGVAAWRDQQHKQKDQSQ